MSAVANYSSYNKSEERIRRNRIRRQRELRQHIFICVISVIIVFTLCFILGNVKSEASNKSDQILYKHFTSIQVNYGDTLTSIANRYVEPSKNTVESFIKEVVYTNDLKDADSITAGCYIIVPYYTTIAE